MPLDEAWSTVLPEPGSQVLVGQVLLADVDALRAEYQAARESHWLPDWHFHERSRRYVHGLIDGDGCFICDGQAALLTVSGVRVVGFSVTEEALYRLERRHELFGEIFFYDRRDFDESLLGLPTREQLLMELSDPKKEDMARWRKQFAPMIDRFEKEARWANPEFTSKKEPNESETDLEAVKGRVQMTISGGSEVIPIGRARGRRRKR